MPFIKKSKLPRLPREWYRGLAVVFWTHTFEHRATGWLSAGFHAQFREVLLHTCGRYELACPVYVLMPDHWHLVWMGLAAHSDQHTATRFLRKHVQRRLGRAKLQDRAHDHVLRDEERKRGAFMSTCHYLFENPVRAGLVPKWEEWPYFGAMVSGYPEFNPRTDDFWDDYWKVYGLLVDRASLPALPSRAT